MHWLCIVAKSHTLCGFPICQPGDHFEKKKNPCETDVYFLDGIYRRQWQLSYLSTNVAAILIAQKI